MKPILKSFIFIITNVIVFFALLVLTDYILYKIDYNRTEISERENYKFFNYNIFSPDLFIQTDFNSEQDYGDGSQGGRKPDGLQYKNEPIVIFGCSFAYGHYLYSNQTFSHKLSKILKRPVYNRARNGMGFQHMYYQTTTNEFYEEVPKSNTVIYVMINDHYKRMLGETFSLQTSFLNLHYKIKDKNLVMDNYNNYLLNFFKFSNTFKLIRHKYKDSYLKNPKNSEKITNEALLYFIKMRENLEKKWNNKIDFYVIFYVHEKIKYEKLLQKKLEDNGFKVIKTSDLTKEDLSCANEKYIMLDNGHPTEAAWDLLVPKIIEMLNK